MLLSCVSGIIPGNVNSETSTPADKEWYFIHQNIYMYIDTYIYIQGGPKKSKLYTLLDISTI